VPVLLAQGAADDLVKPEIQTRFVEARCASGQVLEYVRYDGRDHLAIVADDSPLVGDLMEWTRARFAGTPAPAACTGLPPRGAAR
jgi:alpha-beta hydrolase superfamily lysophospholipase